ncbi:MAG: hypothetical protein M0Q13_12950 [Methanothrix sp.]|jgi:hypothetical protein|nr:hypothetical protein [Methanothrix sp.]
MDDHNFLNKFQEAVYRVHEKHFGIKRDNVIDNDDIVNLKIQIGLFGNDSQKFIDSLKIVGGCE